MVSSAQKSVEIDRSAMQAAIDATKTAGAAAAMFGCSRRTFTKQAKAFGLHRTAKGSRAKFSLASILAGEHPEFPTSHLSKRLVREGVRCYECEECGIDSYNGKPISLELDHIDGNPRNHKLDNLRLLCPNCHSQTPTYRSKKLTWMVGRAAECNRLESGITNRDEGSNPSPSATWKIN